MGYQMKEACCYLCGEIFQHGLAGNPQTWSGIEYAERCKLCERPVCADEKCSISWFTNDETQHKICVSCAEQLSLTDLKTLKNAAHTQVKFLRKIYGIKMPAGFDQNIEDSTSKSVWKTLTDPDIGETLTGCLIFAGLFCWLVYQTLKLI